jgi:alpha,alpha-trehalose phosphorylase
LHVDLEQGFINLTVLEGGPLEVEVRGELLTVDGETLRVALAPVAAPEPTVVPSGPTTASIPVVRTGT